MTQNELRKQKVSYLPFTITLVESLVDFKRPQDKAKGDKNGKPCPRKNKKVKKRKRENVNAKRDARKRKSKYHPNKKACQHNRCYICRGPHLAPDYLKRHQVVTMVE